MEWSDIKIFLQVVRDGTMTEATNSLRMDHSTISRRIARLERSAGAPLFERAGRRLSITVEGERLAAAAVKLESIILREVLCLSEIRAAISGRVRIGTTEEFGAHYLAPRLAKITGEHSGLEIELVAMPRAFSLATREVDLVVTMDRPTTGDIRFKKLTSFEYGIYAVTGYFEGRPRPTSVEDLHDQIWCGHIRELLHTNELELDVFAPGAPEPRYRTTSATAQVATVLSGCALAILPCFIASSDARLERILPDSVRPSRNYWLAVHEDLAESPRVRTVMNAISEQAAHDRSIFLDREPAPVKAEAGESLTAPTKLDGLLSLVGQPSRLAETAARA